ncbi:hypothetical protein MF265_21635 [Serratia marcescens]|uniref:reverse transcriptase domain-containing protein n=1 Tax=Serratia marcescens TaxID=615 RepID=UPI001EF1340B|nr:reverse transcriptase domain-containing protein [Serratia marcescens]ULH10496.1 hypothetical protein MF265_21635 [Serratia marcescens]
MKKEVSPMNILSTELASSLCRTVAGENLDVAWVWLCDARKDAPDNADIWHLRHHWPRTRDALLTSLLAGHYRLMPMLLTKKRPLRDRQVMWGAQDALVLKWVSLFIAPSLDLHPSCEHVKGHGGGPQSVQRMVAAIKHHQYAWVCRTDVKGYYRNINKDLLMNQVNQHITDPVLLGLIHQYLHYTVEDGGEFHTPESGIARGCALSPLMGALHLYAMDAWFGKQMAPANEQKKKGIYYARYMDDIVILAHSRWQLRKQVRALNRYFNDFGFCQHPDKTFIGRIERGFDWMGAQMSDVGVEGIAHRARVNHIMRWRRLYEQVRRWPAARRRARMSQYRKKWKIWAGCLLLAPACVMDVHAGIGTAADLDRGIRACMLSGALSVSSDGATWGGTCAIPLLNSTFTPTYVSTKGCNNAVDATTWNAGIIQWNANYGTGGNYRSWTSLELTRPLQIAGDLTYSAIQAVWPAGTHFSAPLESVPSAAAPAPGVRMWQSCSSFPDQHPNDAITTAGSGILNSQNLYGPPPTGILTWSVLLRRGSIISYPNVTLSIDNGYIGVNRTLSLGVGGNNNVDPTPAQPPIAGDVPNCSAITGIAPVSDFGTAHAAAGAGYLTSSKSVPAHVISLSCVASTGGNVAASATFYAQSSLNKWTDNATLQASPNDWMGLFFTMPASLPPGVTLAAGQKLNSDLKWNASNPTPLWTWSIPARSTAGAITVPSVSLQPRLYQTGSQGAQFGPRSYTVQYSVVLQ